MSLPYTRRTPSLPPTESTLAPSQVQHQLSSSTLANPHSSPLRSPPGPSSEGRTVPKSPSPGSKAARSRKAGGFLLDSAAGSNGGELERYREREREQEQEREYGYRGGLGAGLFSQEMSVRSYRETTPEIDEGLVIEDIDPARIVSLALASGATRKVGTSRRVVQQRSASANRWVPDVGSGSGSGDGKDRWLSASSTLFGQQAQQGRGQAISPNRGFLVARGIDKRRSASTSGYSPRNGARQLSPLNPFSSPPPPPGPISQRQGYPSPLSPLPLPSSTFPYQQLQGGRGLQEQRELRELQRQYKFTEATLQRTLKAKQQLELSDLYKRLLEIYPSSNTTLAGTAKYGSVGSATGRVYNPLMSIRNKKIRNRERIQLDLSSWEDPGAVEQWVEDVAVAVHDSIEDGHTRPFTLPPPPQPSMSATKTKRPRLDWVVFPQELFAEFYWIEQVDRLRREEMHSNGEEVQREEQTKNKGSHTSLKSLMEKEQRKYRGSLELSRKKWSVLDLTEDGNIVEPTKKGSKKWPKQSGEFHRSLLQLGSNRNRSEDFVHSNPPSSSDESGHSSESEVDYASDYSDTEVEISGPEVDAKAKRKHHRRRRKLGQIITGGKHSKRSKRKQGDAYTLDADERQKRQEQEEVEWMAEMGGRMVEPIVRTYSVDEECDSAAGRNGDPRKQDVLKMTVAETGVSLPNTLGSKSSLERYGKTTGLSAVVVGRKSVDFAEVVVPSIAISLNPPRDKARDEGYDTDGRGRAKRKEEERGKEGKRKSSPTKRFLERGQEAFGKVREGSLDRRRESLDVDGLIRKGTYKDKEKESRKDRLKGRVEKIRSEVGTKVDHFIFKRDSGGSAQQSPTGSSFEESIGSRSDDDRIHLSRENTISASEPEDEGRSGRAWGRSSLEVPDSRRPMGRTKYKGPFLLNVLPSIASPGAPPSPALVKGRRTSKAGLLQDDLAASDMDTDDSRTSRPYTLVPPTREASREPSPARSVLFLATDKKRLLPGDRSKSVPLEAVKTLPKAPTLPLVATDEERIIIPACNNTPENIERPVFATRKELMMVKAYLTRSGIVARGITAKRARESGAAGIVAITREHILSSAVVSRDINVAEQAFVRKANYFTDSTILELRRSIDRIRENIEMELMPWLTGVADGADELNEELTTTCTLAVKRINDEVAAMARRKRRHLRWVRRGGYVLLEWVLLGVMWWVWSVVVILNIIRNVCRGVIGALRWILWI